GADPRGESTTAQSPLLRPGYPHGSSEQLVRFAVARAGRTTPPKPHSAAPQIAGNTGLRTGTSGADHGSEKSYPVHRAELDHGSYPHSYRLHPHSEQIAGVRSRLGHPWLHGQGGRTFHRLGKTEGGEAFWRSIGGCAPAGPHTGDPDRSSSERQQAEWFPTRWSERLRAALRSSRQAA